MEGYWKDGPMAHSLAELSESIFATFGLTGTSSRIECGDLESDRVCLLLIDGFGRNSYLEYARQIPSLEELTYLATLQATFPSTTATSLTSLGTGLASGRHGMVGYTMRIPYSGRPERTLNALKWDERVDPQIWQPHPTLFERAIAQGVKVSQVANRRYANTGFTRAALRGAQYLGANSIVEMVAQARIALAQPGSFAYLYLNDVDEASHGSGYGSDRYLAALKKVEELIATLVHELPKRTRLYVTSDHGMINRNDYEIIGSDNDLLLDVELLAGEPRVRYLYVSEGKQELVRDRWREYLGDRAAVLTRDEAIGQGLFGEVVEQRVVDRIGDLVVVARDGLILVELARQVQQLAMVGHHGGMTAEEVEIPLLARTI